MYKTYLLTYDPLMIDPTPQRLIEFVRTHAYTYQLYVLHLGSIYIKSTYSLWDMVVGYREFLSPNMWTIVEVQAPTIQSAGSAPIQFWNWLNAAEPPPIPSPNK